VATHEVPFLRLPPPAGTGHNRRPVERHRRREVVLDGRSPAWTGCLL